MSKEKLDDNYIDSIIRLLHPVPKRQNGNCPYIEWMGYDLGHCPGVGEYKCKLSTYVHGKYDQNFSYDACNSKDYNECFRYKLSQAKKDTQEKICEEK